MRSYKLLVMCFSIFLLQTSNAEIYKWEDADGNVHFGDKKPDDHESENIQLKINTYQSVTIEPGVIKSEKKSNTKQNVIIYSADWCGVCKQAKKYFNNNNIVFTEYDIEKDMSARARFSAMGAKGVPVIFIGNRRMNGFTAAAFERIYR